MMMMAVKMIRNIMISMMMALPPLMIITMKNDDDDSPTLGPFFSVKE